MKHITAAVIIASMCCFVACGKSKSSDTSKADKGEKTGANKSAYTCEQVVDHIYPIMLAFRKSANSPYAKMAKQMDESPAAVKKRKASTIRTCKQRKYTQAELHCFITTKSVEDITSCADIWRQRTGGSSTPPVKAGAKTN